MTDKHILVVEDDPDGQEMVTTILRHLNFVVDTADDAEQALVILHETKTYDAIIIDLALPGKDGWELLADILENSKIESIPCIAVTAYHNSKLREQALHAGFTAYFPKPLESTQLGRALDDILSD